jgi:hypothetical protein
MKIGILTYFHGLNPGTIIQAYATYLNVKQIYSLDDVEIINYAFKKDIYRPHFVNLSVSSVLNDLMRIKKYKTFKMEYFSFSNQRFLSTDYEKTIDFIISQKYDKIFVGADTLLELNRVKDGLTPYWLSDRINSSKIFLAASAKNVTLENLTLNQNDMIRRTIGDFSSIGVRDEATYRLFEGFLNGKQISRLVQIPDPAFTLQIDYSYVEKYIDKRGIDFEKPIICFHLKKDDSWGKKTAIMFKELGYQIASFRPERFADILLNDLGPMEYMGIFKYFSLMITNKFHDTVFCLKNKTPMLTFPLSDNYANSSGESKYTSLLKQFDLLESNFIQKRASITPMLIKSKFENAIYAVQSKSELIDKQIELNKDLYISFLLKTKMI